MPDMNKILLAILFILPLNIAMATDRTPALLTNTESNSISSESILRVGVIGLVHTHVHWILGRKEQGDIEIVGIVEPNRALAEEYAERHSIL